MKIKAQEYLNYQYKINYLGMEVKYKAVMGPVMILRNVACRRLLSSLFEVVAKSCNESVCALFGHLEKFKGLLSTRS